MRRNATCKFALVYLAIKRSVEPSAQNVNCTNASYGIKQEYVNASALVGEKEYY